MSNIDDIEGFHRRFRQSRLFASEVSAEASINAPIQEVWQALIAFDDYAQWNPFTPEVRCDLKIGSPVHLHVDMPLRSASKRTEWLNKFEPPHTFCWGMHMGHPLLLTANRWQILTPLDDKTTKYRTVDKFSGILTPLVLGLYGRPMKLGFQSVADGLKTWVETESD